MKHETGQRHANLAVSPKADFQRIASTNTGIR
jgi:hypothetical protein